MNANPKTFHTTATSVHCPAQGFSLFAFALPDGMMLCAEGEVGVMLSHTQLATHRGTLEWKMFLVARGMLSPSADILAGWLAATHTPIPTISDGEAKCIDAPSD